MEKNAYLNFNPRKCEKHLSSFGKKVLHALIKQWDIAREEKTKHHYNKLSQNRQNNNKILHFNNEIVSNSLTLPVPRPPPLQVYSTDNAFDFNLTDEVEPEIPTSKELTSQNFESAKDNEFVHPTIISRNIVHEVINTGSNDAVDEHIFQNISSSFDLINKNETSGVSWDMFDSELFGEAIENDIANEDTNNDSNYHDVLFVGKNSNTLIKANDIKDEKCGEKRKIKTIGEPKGGKKPKKDKLNEPRSKAEKVTNSAVPKNSLRKQKYTKAVKNWLKDVELCDSHNEEVTTEDIAIVNHIIPITSETEQINKEVDQSNSAGISNKAKIDKSKITIDKPKITIDKPKITIDKPKITIDKTQKANKKTVQAQLTNKDGIMKFSKPKNETFESKKVTKKFVPPIKSQIPVKDITYEIFTIDDNNIQEYFYKLHEIDNEEVIIAMIYSNGFCQLNSNFTDNAGSTDGLLISDSNMFYCIKGAGQKLQETLAHILESNNVICYEGQSILIYLATQLQMKLDTVNMYDAKVGASLLDPDNPPESFSDLQKLLSFVPSHTIATECILQKAAWYITLLRECWTKLKDMLIEQQLWQVFVEVEMKLLPIIAKMERRGVLIDQSKLKSMEEVLQCRMKQVEQQCYKAAGKVFQINSTVQVRSILYDELQLDTKCNVKIRETLAGGVKSTSESMLRSLVSVHSLPKLILEYRHLHKAHATFLAGIAQHIKDGVVKPTWVQTAAATGRIASNNPNLQAIPKTPFSLVMFPEADDTDNVQVNFRSVYVSRPGCSLVAADFKHVECRVFAHAAADTGLLTALTQADDLFRVLAAQWLNKPESSVTAAERDRTKRLVYASLYGAGTRKLMEILDVSYEQALQVAASFNRTFPSLKSFGRHVVTQCAQAGGRLSTLRGRVRHFANISSEDFNLRSHAERQAVNFIVQGSAADICKTAMVLTEEKLRDAAPEVEANLVLQIHDELVWEVNDQHLHTAADIIKQVMEGCGRHCGMTMSLPVAITVGKNWGQMEEYHQDS